MYTFTCSSGRNSMGLSSMSNWEPFFDFGATASHVLLMTLVLAYRGNFESERKSGGTRT